VRQANVAQQEAHSRKLGCLVHREDLVRVVGIDDDHHPATGMGDLKRA
jgi:hypothetical protein